MRGHGRTLAVYLAALSVGVLAPAGAVAQTTPKPREDRSFSPETFHPAPGPDEFITVEAAAPLLHKGYGFGLFFNYARNPFTIFNYDDNTKSTGGAHNALIKDALSAEAWAGIGLFNRFQIAVSLPMTLYQHGTDLNSVNPLPDGTHVKAPNGYALGDPRLYLKARVYGKETGLQFAFSHWLSFPFGNDKNFGGEQHFTGFSGELRALLGFESKRFRAGGFVGFLWRAHPSVFFSTDVGQMMTYGAAAAYDLVLHRLSLVAELFGAHNFKESINVSPLELDLAAKVTVYRGLSLNIGVGNGLVSGLGSPQPRVYLGLVYAPDTRDRDHDGVPDQYDSCPDAPEDRDHFHDEDGCPDPDNDNDGILDINDKCPNTPEDVDGFQDEDGCPDPDNDNDGIVDKYDACPNDPEDGKEPKPKDGCPKEKGDSDDDGIPDNVDKCPLDAEDMDGFEDEDGCPDIDNDQDGFPDNLDDCPNEPETMNGYQDDDGCPDQIPGAENPPAEETPPPPPPKKKHK